MPQTNEKNEGEFTDEKLGQQQCLIICAVLLGIVAGFVATVHLGKTMWGDSPYSEASLMWTSDNSGNSRFGNYADSVFVLGAVFAFMFSTIPIAAMIATANPSLYW